eukprot:gene11420-4587_t
MGNTLGGAQNKNTFDKNLAGGILPPLSSITYGGSFNEYYFNDNYNKLDEIFYFQPSIACSKDPLSEEMENYISITLHSSKDGLNERDPLNLILCLDISGSMAEKLENETKMKVSNEVICEIINSLTDEERVGIVLFDENVEILQEMKKIKQLNKEELNKKVLEIKEQGGTNMTNAFNEAVKMIQNGTKNSKENDPKNNRIIFLTDAIPNLESEKNLFQSIEQASILGIYSTFIGIGLDFNTDVVDEITKVKCANYFSVHSKKEFEKVLKIDFNYIVSPCVISSHLLLESNSFSIIDAFGTPFPKETTKKFIELGSSCASDTIGNETKGGLILIKIEKEKENDNIDLILNYKTNEFDKEISKIERIKFNLKEEYYENEAIRKGIVLKRYVDFMKKIIKSEENEKERIKQEMKQFNNYLIEECNLILDPQLKKEIEKIEQIKYAKFEKVNTESLGYLKRKMRRDLMITNLSKTKSKSKIVEVEKIQRENGKLLLKLMKNGKLEEIEKLLKQGAFPNLSDENGNYPIHLAMERNDSFDILKLFFDEIYYFETDINSQNKKGETILHLSCHQPNSDLVSYLLDKGVDPNIQDENGDTCLHVLSQISNHKNIHHYEHLQHCLDYGTNLDVKNKKGEFCNQITKNIIFIRKFMDHKFDTSTEVSGGDVEIGLFWNNLNDLDLHCICRCKNEISYAKRDCLSCFAHLDVDMNVSITNDPKVSSNTPVEHIFWPIIVPGEYSVQVHHYQNHQGIVNETPYFISIMLNGNSVFEYEGVITEEKKDTIVNFEFDKERNFKIIKE